MKVKQIAAIIGLSTMALAAQSASAAAVFAVTDTMSGDSFQSKSYGFTVGDLGLPTLAVSLVDNMLPTAFQFLQLAVTNTGGATMGSATLAPGSNTGSFSFNLAPGAYTAIVFGLPGSFNLPLLGGGTREVFAGTYGFSVSAVPEPSTYALLLAGLGMIGFAARRRLPV